jgi:hypothetical protein
LEIQPNDNFLFELAKYPKINLSEQIKDTIMLTSGVFQVKLLKKGTDLGISVMCMYRWIGNLGLRRILIISFFYLHLLADPRYFKNDDYPLISDIKKGSVAYRSGMLESGDRLMYIDNHSVRGKSINDINQMLKTCDELVKLKIKKDDVYTGGQIKWSRCQTQTN